MRAAIDEPTVPGDRVWVTLAADGLPASGPAKAYTVVRAERAFWFPDIGDRREAPQLPQLDGRIR